LAPSNSLAVIPLSTPDLRGRERENLIACVEDNWVSSAGPFVTQFEDSIAALTNRAHAIACVNGTAALTASLMGLGVGRGDLVIVPDWTFAATANAVLMTGAEPAFVDVSATDWCMDADSAISAVRRFGARVKAVIVVDAAGRVAAPTTIDRIHSAFDGPILVDAAGSIGSTRAGQPAGSTGDLATFSFNGNKTVTAGGGGMIMTDDAEVAGRIRHLSTQARVAADYRHDAIGFNFRMTNLNAAVGMAQLDRMADMIAEKRKTAETYREAVRHRPDIRFMPFDLEDCTDSGWLSNVVVGSEADARSLVAHLDDLKISARPFWCRLSDQPPYSDYPAVETPVSASLTDRVVTLPSSSHLTDADLNRVLDGLDGWHGTDLEPA